MKHLKAVKTFSRLRRAKHTPFPTPYDTFGAAEVLIMNTLEIENIKNV
jgi:hypothetical protein